MSTSSTGNNWRSPAPDRCDCQETRWQCPLPCSHRSPEQGQRWRRQGQRRSLSAKVSKGYLAGGQATQGGSPTPAAQGRLEPCPAPRAAPAAAPCLPSPGQEGALRDRRRPGAHGAGAHLAALPLPLAPAFGRRAEPGLAAPLPSPPTRLGPLRLPARIRPQPPTTTTPPPPPPWPPLTRLPPPSLLLLLHCGKRQPEPDPPHSPPPPRPTPAAPAAAATAMGAVTDGKEHADPEAPARPRGVGAGGDPRSGRPRAPSLSGRAGGRGLPFPSLP